MVFGNYECIYHVNVWLKSSNFCVCHKPKEASPHCVLFQIKSEPQTHFRVFSMSLGFVMLPNDTTKMPQTVNNPR